MSESSWLGKLDSNAFAILDVFREPNLNNAIASGAGCLEIIAALAIALMLTRYKLWRTLWQDWLTSADHKKIGIMYIVLALVMFARAIAEGAIMRLHQATALNGDGILTAHHFAELFSTHGTIMIFFVAMPLVLGFINYLVPLQIGARDMAFPVMNQISLGLTASGAALLLISLVIGEFDTGGWTAYPSYTSSTFTPAVGPDYWLWSVLFSGIGSMLSGINFAVTIYKLRAPGMKLMYMPLFTWTALCTSILIIFAMPPITVASVLLALDRYLDFHFFTNDLGGNLMNYANLFWMFGHPEVYILILPAYGVFSEISATFSAKTLYGYRSLVLATMCIAVLSFTVWLHHFFTMGQSASINAAFGIATLLIAIPTGVKVYDWLATLFRGRIRVTVPMVYLAGFFILFTIGGMSGIILANPSIDFQVHNSLFLVAHFHNVLVPGLLFGMLAGVHYWFPKAFGYRLHERWGIRTALLWIVGFSVTFLPLYWVGLNGMPRRSASYFDPSYVPWMVLTAAGAALLLCALGLLCFTFWKSYRQRHALLAQHGDPWDGRTLEWWTSSPPPEFNFAKVPAISGQDAFWFAKQQGDPYAPVNDYQDIVMPGRSAMGISYCAVMMLLGFSLTWHIFWLAGVMALAIPTILIVRSFYRDETETLSAETIASTDRKWREQAQSAPGITRAQETHPTNQGKAIWEGVSND